MTEHDFSELLSRAESDTLDFKATQYDFSGSDDEKKEKRAKFVKDILCLANTPKQSPAYIVLGVNRLRDGTNDLWGIAQHVDDAVLQDKVTGWLHPNPRFSYETVQYQGKSYGLITIPAAREMGPFFCIGDGVGDILTPNRLYFRRSSKNAIASPEEQRAIYAWFIGQPHHQLPMVVDSSKSPWDAFLESVDHFDPRRSFVLLLSPMPRNISATDLQGLGAIDWFFVADFDPTSQADGTLGACREIVESRRGLHILTKGDRLSFSPRNATYWYLPRGLDGRSETLATGKWLDWHRAYSQDVAEKVRETAKTIPRPVTIVALWYSDELTRHLNTFLESLLPQLGEGVDLLIVSDAADSFAELATEYGAQVVQIPLAHLLGGLAHLSGQRGEASDRIVVPTSSGGLIELEPKMVGWLEEELDIVHPNLGLRPPPDASGINEFLRGKPISWFDLALHVDVERDLQSKLSRVIEGILQKRRCVRVNLYHEPGAGGSTLSRRIVWDLRRSYPCLLLRRCDPKQTVERLQKLFSVSGNPLVVLAEGNCLSEQESDELANLLASRNVPSVILQVLRRFERPRRLSEHSFHLEAVLTDGERHRFEHTLVRDVPPRATAIRGALESRSEVEGTPFYLGLVAFEREFVSLEAHIERHLAQLNGIQQKALLYLAIAHYYGQLSLDSQLFASLFGLPANKPVDFSNAFSEYALRLLVKTGAGSWRPGHHLISAELLEQALSAGLGDRRLWRTRLSDVALEFADFCADCDGKTWDTIADLLQRVFIFRDDADFLGTEQAGSARFSRIIMDIPVDEGRLRVFLRLTELYPENHHFWAHLGRFYANQLKEHATAIEAIDRALALCERDPLMHHMKGMVFRNWTYDKMRDSASLEQVLETAKLASECFQAARALSPEDTHGFISEVQLVTRVLDYSARTTGKTAVRASSDHSDKWLREGFDVAEGLLEEVRRKRQGETESEYETRCRADLSALYGRHAEALQTWQNLLDRRTAYAPPVRRQIVRTILSRNEQRWANMSERDLSRTVELLEQNMTEEPNDARNIRLWLRALRVSRKRMAIEEVADKVAYWATATDSLEAYYYLYVLHALLAIAGSALAADRVESALEKCRTQARYRRDRTQSHEWLGLEEGLSGLVHKEELGHWDRQANFWEKPQPLRRIGGVICQIRGQEAGTIEIGGMKAFFVPGVSGHSFGEAENRPVTFFLGFSYDGLRAWSVEDAKA